MGEDAIKSSKKSKGLRPDKIAPIHLHFIAKQAIKYLSKLISLSLSNAIIPENWKVGRVIPLSKPGKDPEQAKIYQPIALFSPVVKLSAFYFTQIQF